MVLACMNINIMFPHRPPEHAERVDDVGDVLLLPEVVGLEDVALGHAVLLDGLVEPVGVLHHLEAGPARVDFGDAAGGELVHQLAEDHAVLQGVLFMHKGS